MMLTKRQHDVRFLSRVFCNERAARKGDLTVLRIDTDLPELVAEDFARNIFQKKIAPVGPKP